MTASANHQPFRKSAVGATANLPPRGGDVRQDRGGRRRALASTKEGSHASYPTPPTKPRKRKIHAPDND